MSLHRAVAIRCFGAQFTATPICKSKRRPGHRRLVKQPLQMNLCAEFNWSSVLHRGISGPLNGHRSPNMLAIPTRAWQTTLGVVVVDVKWSIPRQNSVSGPSKGPGTSGPQDVGYSRPVLCLNGKERSLIYHLMYCSSRKEYKACTSTSKRAEARTIQSHQSPSNTTAS